MFILLDPEKRQEKRFGEMVIAYHEAPGDAGVEMMMRVARDPVTGEPKQRKTVSECLAPYVVDWSGVGDATGQAIPWPAAGAIGSEVAPEALGLRAGLLGRLPWNVLIAIDLAVWRSFEEGKASGKG